MFNLLYDEGFRVLWMTGWVGRWVGEWGVVRSALFAFNDFGHGSFDIDTR